MCGCTRVVTVYFSYDSVVMIVAVGVFSTVLLFFIRWVSTRHASLSLLHTHTALTSTSRVNPMVRALTVD